jgi:hypothetical protein
LSYISAKREKFSSSGIYNEHICSDISRKRCIHEMNPVTTGSNLACSWKINPFPGKSKVLHRPAILAVNLFHLTCPHSMFSLLFEDRTTCLVQFK